jgi:hypothetical protein
LLCAVFPVVAVFRFGVCLCRLPFRLVRLRWLRVRLRRYLRRSGFAVFNGSGVVAVAGSRALPASGSALVVRVVADLAAGGFSLVVGCCTGADAAVLSAVPRFVPPSFVRCLSGVCRLLALMVSGRVDRRLLLRLQGLPVLAVSLNGGLVVRLRWLCRSGWRLELGRWFLARQPVL